MKNVFIKSQAVLLLVFSLFAAAITAGFISTLTNSMSSHTEWLVPRHHETELSLRSHNAERFFDDPIALSKGVLNLGVWHGHHEIRTVRRYSDFKIKLKYRLSEASYFFVVFKDEKGNGKGIRVSGTSLYPPIRFDLADTYEFSAKTAFGQLVSDQEWHEVELDPFAGPLFLEPGTDYTVSLIGGGKPTFIDDVTLTDRKNAILFSEDFGVRPESFVTIFLPCFGLISILLILIGLYFDKESLFKALLVCGVYCAVGGLSWASYYFVLSQRYLFVGAANPIQLEYQFNWLKEAFPLESAGLPDFVVSKPEKNLSAFQRIIFIGSSQTRGEGASQMASRWTNLTCKKLNIAAQDCLNHGLSGAFSPVMRAELESIPLNSKDLVIVNAGSNDTDAGVFKTEITKIIQVIKSQGAQPFLILEANEPQVNARFLARNHKEMLACCRENRVLCLDMHRYLMSRELFDTGLMWNDHVHPTNFTNSKMAEFISNVLAHFRQ